MARYYKLDSRKITYREYWNILRSWQVIIPWTAKLLHIPMKFGSGLPSFESVRELEIAESDFPARAREKLQPLLDQCERKGFHSPRFYSYAAMHGETRTSFIALLHRSGATVRLMYVASTIVHPPKEKLLVVLLSELRDGTFFVTSGQKPQFLSAPGIVVNRLVGAGPDQLLESHLQKLAALPMNNPPKPVGSVEVLDQIWDKYEKLSRDFGMQRGIYVWMPAEEAEAGEQKLAEAKTMAPGGTENMDVLLAINQLQNKKAGWGNVIIILVVSLILFAGAGARQWSSKFVLMVVPILFVHELGHYLAMRTFHYRNLRMFFIPFFGAAVSGQHFNVPGWKKVLVSLMGPVPGIILGVIAGSAGLILHQALLTKVALLSLVLNGFNLLPVLPLDGGWVFHTLLFSRHYLLDAAFRVLAAGALIAGGMLIHSKILMFLGIPMILSVPAVYRQARIARTLRERGIPPASTDDQTIPADTAQAIIGEVKKSISRPQPNKLLAQQTLQIFETLNARPPGWAATIGLLFAHAASFGLAAVFTVVFVIAQRGDLRQMIEAADASRHPKHHLDCGPLLSWTGNLAADASGGPGITVIGNFSKPGAAGGMFQDLTNRLPATVSLKLFGDALLLSLPAGQDALRKEWLGKFQRSAAGAFVEGTNSPVMFSLSWSAPNEQMAEAIADELDGYFLTLPGQSLVPPWLPQDGRSAEERARHELARQTFVKLHKAQYQYYDNAGLIALQKRVSDARRKGDEAGEKALSREITQLMEDLQKQGIERVRNGVQGPVDTNIVDLFSARSYDQFMTNGTDDRTLQVVARRMGQLPLVNGRASPNEERFSAHMGVVVREGSHLNLMLATFNHVADGAPALVEWLCGKGCVDFKYDLKAGADLEGDGPDQ